MTDARPGSRPIRNVAAAWSACNERPTLDGENKAQLLYRGICAGCHGYDLRLIGQTTVTTQAIYGDDAQGTADCMASPEKKRPDYPEMPPQAGAGQRDSFC